MIIVKIILSSIIVLSFIATLIIIKKSSKYIERQYQLDAEFCDILSKLEQTDIEEVERLEHNAKTEKKVQFALMPLIGAIATIFLLRYIGVEGGEKLVGSIIGYFAFFCGFTVMAGIICLILRFNEYRYRIKKVDIKKKILKIMDENADFSRIENFTKEYNDAQYKEPIVFALFTLKSILETGNNYFIANVNTFSLKKRDTGFYGVVLNAKMNKSFRGYIYLHNSYRFLTTYDRRSLLRKMEINIDDLAQNIFSKQIHCYCTNKDIVHKFLTPNVRNIMLKYARGNMFDLVIFDNNIYIRIENRQLTSDESEHWEKEMYKEYININFLKSFANELINEIENI